MVDLGRLNTTSKPKLTGNRYYIRSLTIHFGFLQLFHSQELRGITTASIAGATIVMVAVSQLVGFNTSQIV
jgi:hypothetical protein